MADIRLAGVTKRFGAVVAVKDVNLEIRHREFLGVIGPSACGKTTLLRLIAGLDLPDAGRIYIDGKLATEIKTRERGIQLVFQDYALWPHLKVFEKKSYSNLSFPMRVRKWLRDEIISRVNKVNSSVGIEESLYDRRPAALSEGQKQRVALSRALVVVPKALLLDEPMSNLDPPSHVKIREELKKLHHEYGMTTVMVTHNIADAFAIADRMVIMREGGIVQAGSPKDIYERPADSFIRDFIRCYDVGRYLG